MMGFSEMHAWYLQLSLPAVRTRGLWSADVLGTPSPYQGMPWEVGRARDIWKSLEIGQRDRVLLLRQKLPPQRLSNSFACLWRTRKGRVCLDLLVSVLCVFVYVFRAMCQSREVKVILIGALYPD